MESKKNTWEAAAPNIQKDKISHKDHRVAYN